MSAKVFLSSPCHTGMLPIHYHVSAIEMGIALRMNGMVLYRDQMSAFESDIARARNVEVHRFLKTDCTHMFIFDSDQMLKPPTALVNLIALDLPIVGIPVALKTARCEWNFTPLPGRLDIVNNLFEVSRIGTGCLLIRRDALETMIQASPDDWFFLGQPEFMGEPIPYLFDNTIDPTSRLWLSEDYGFCEKWKRTGGKIFAWCGADVGHVGIYDYGKDFADYVAACQAEESGSY